MGFHQYGFKENHPNGFIPGVYGWVRDLPAREVLSFFQGCNISALYLLKVRKNGTHSPIIGFGAQSIIPFSGEINEYADIELIRTYPQEVVLDKTQPSFSIKMGMGYSFWNTSKISLNIIPLISYQIIDSYPYRDFSKNFWIGGNIGLRYNLSGGRKSGGIF